MILERNVRLFLHRTDDASSGSRIRQQIVGVGKQELIPWHRRSLHDVLNRQAVGQFARTVYLNPIIEDKNTYRCLPVQRPMYQRVDRELNQCCDRNLQFAQRIEFRLHLYIAQISREEIHDGVVLMQQTALHIFVPYLVAKRGAAHRVAHIADALRRVGRQPSLRIFAKQQHGGHRHLAVGTNKAQVAQQPLYRHTAYHHVNHLLQCVVAQVHFADTALLHRDRETVQQILLYHLLVQVFQREVVHGSFVRRKTATLAHHLCQFCIVKHAPLV